jgi:chemotaxis protein histidine kinase CheA
MATTQHQILDVVELRVDSGRWPAGTIGTVVEADSDQALVEISDDRGHGLDFISLPHDALAPHQQPSQQLAS